MFFLLNFGQGVFAPLLPEVMKALGISVASAGLLGTSFGVARVLIDVPAGAVADRVGVERLLQVGIACLAAGSLLSGIALNLPIMIVGRGLVGLGSGMSIVVAVLYLMRCAPAARRTRLGNIYEMSVVGGMAVSSALAGIIAVRLGWRWGFVLAMLAIGLGYAIARLRIMPAMQAMLDFDFPVPNDRCGQRERRHFGMHFPIYLATFTLAFWWAGVISTYLPLYGGVSLNLPADVVGRSLAVAYGVEVCLLFPAGWASDTIGRVPLLLTGFLVMLIGVLIVPKTQSAVAFSIASTLCVAGMTVWMIPPALLAERLAGGLRGRIVGVYRLVGDCGSAVAPAATGWLIAEAGFGAGGISFAGLVALSICVSVVALKRIG